MVCEIWPVFKSTSSKKMSKVQSKSSFGPNDKIDVDDNAVIDADTA